MKKYIIIFVLLGFSGCINFENIGKDLVTGAGKGLENKDSLFSAVAGSFTRGAIDSVNLSKLKDKVNLLVDSIFANLGDKSKKELVSLADSLLGDALVNKIHALGGASKLELAGLRDELLGSKTLNLIAAMRNNLLGDTTLLKISAIRDELLGDKTSKLLNDLISSSLDTLLVKYNRIQPQLSKDIRAEETFLTKNITTILWTVGGIVAGLIVLCFVLNYKRKQYQSISEMLAGEIDKIPDQDLYDELTKRIRTKAQDNKLEPKLRKVLASKGILGEEAWVVTKKYNE